VRAKRIPISKPPSFLELRKCELVLLSKAERGHRCPRYQSFLFSSLPSR
jgi:hypothetical protein